MRKVLSFVLVLALVLGSFSMAFAAPFSDMANEKSSEAVTVLKDLGVVAGYPDGTFRPDQIVTRAEMARFVIAALGLEQFATGTTSKYPDMVQAPWAQGYVAYATSIGFISGYPDGTFKPNQQVSFQEAASMLVRALGYTEAFLPGGWPAEWMIKANSLGIFDDVTMASGAAGADRGAIAQMLYNSLTLEIGQVNNENVWSKFEPEDTMMKRLGVKTTTTAALEYTADSKVNIISKVGVKGTIYWDGDDIISVKADSTQLTGKYNAGTKKFDVGSTAYSFKTGLATTDVAVYFENAEVVEDSVQPADSTKTVTLAVKLSGTTITEIHSLSVWTETKAAKMSSAQVKAIADNDEVLLETLGTDVEGNVDTNSFLLVGADSLSDIAKDDIVYVYTADVADEIRMIAVGTDTVSGRVTAKSSSTTNPSYTIGGKAYKAAKTELWNVASDPTLVVGNEYDVMLDAYGYIYSVEQLTANADKYGVMLAYDAGNALDDARLRLFLADGTTKIFSVDSAVTVNFATGAAVAYSVDKDGVIDDIDAAMVATDAGLIARNLLGIHVGEAYDTTPTTTKPIATDAVVFTVSTATLALVNADALDVTTLAKVDLRTGLSVGGIFTYFLNADGDEVVAMVINSASGAVSDDVYAVVNSYTVEWDAVNEVAFDRIKGFADGVALDSAASSTGFGAGKAGAGLYLVKFNSDDEISVMTTQTAVNVANVTFSALNAAGNAISVTNSGIIWYALNLDDLVVYQKVLKANGTFDKYVVSDLDSISEGNVVHIYDTLDGTGNEGNEVVIWWK